MISDDQLTSIIQELAKNNFAFAAIEGMNVRLSFWHDGQTLHLATSVYHGENYIPPSVRKALGQNCIEPSHLFKASLSVDEENFLIFLETECSWEESSVKETLYEFTWIADEWKRWLNEKGKEDLLPIYLKK
jgi:hypothetical protein